MNFIAKIGCATAILCSLGAYLVYLGDSRDSLVLTILGCVLIAPFCILYLVLNFGAIVCSIEDSIMASRWKKMPKAKWDVGNIFAIPLGDGSYAIGQVMTREPFGIYHVTWCSFFNKKVMSLEAAEIETFVAADCISIKYLVAESLDRGTWPVVGTRKVIIEEDAFPESKYIMRPLSKDFDLENFLKAYHHLPCKEPNFPISDYLNFPSET